MNQKKMVEITQTEIDMAKEEYFKNGGVIQILRIQGAKPKKERDARRKVSSTGDGA